ncbi:unnamed protein product [Closterium sp. Yama58-4]|nr:unnamed protein product [Closterium sp. Yama58-4]
MGAAKGVRHWCAVPFASHALFRGALRGRNVRALLIGLALVGVVAIVPWRALLRPPTVISGLSASSTSRPTAADLHSSLLSGHASSPAVLLQLQHQSSAFFPQLPLFSSVRGPDAANLGSTREVQRDLWAHQFPAGPCHGRRLLLVHWPHPHPPPNDTHSSGDSSDGGRSGFGAWEVVEMLAGMAGALSVAPSPQRPLPTPSPQRPLPTPSPQRPLPTPSLRARPFMPSPPHTRPGMPCSPSTAVNESGSLHCYFFRSVSPACEAAAMHQYRAAGSPPCLPLSHLANAVASNDSLVCALATLHPSSRSHSAAARAWGDAYKQRPYLVEERGVMVNASEDHMQAYWWQAQALRFLLRWPSLHLCHATNRMRHSAYGLRTAVLSAAQVAEQRAILAALWSPYSDAHQHLGINTRSEASLLAAIDFSKPHNLETDVWPALGFVGCADSVRVELGAGGVRGESEGGEETAAREARGGGAVDARGDAGGESGGEGEEDAREEKPQARVTYERVGREVGMPRPVVSVHVEQHAGAGAQALLPLAYRLRRLDPALQFAWLSAEEPGTLSRVQHLSTSAQHLRLPWTFLHPTDTALEEHDATAAILSSLLIASECDYLAGALNSTWNRVVHALRSTNGRLYSGVVS